MRLRVGESHLPDLLAYLRERPDCVAVDAGGGFVAVSLLGSRNLEENLVELEERLEGWRARYAGVHVELAVAA